MAKAPFGFTKPEDSLGFLLWQITVIWQRLIKKALDGHNVSHAQFVLLALLLWFEQHQQEPTQVSLIHKSKLDKMTVSKSLKSLAQQGLVQRVEHETDTRAKRVSLTDQGKTLVRKLVPQVEKTDALFFETLSSEEQQSLHLILTKLLVTL